MERYSMLTDWKYLVQPSSEKLPPTADGKKYKHPQSRHYKENERFWNTKTKWEVSIKSLTQEVREPLKRGGKKSVRARGDGGHLRWDGRTPQRGWRTPQRGWRTPR